MYLKVATDADASKLSELLKDGDWMVLYYAEWCGHCNAMKPEWEKFITKMKDKSINNSNIKIIPSAHALIKSSSYRFVQADILLKNIKIYTQIFIELQILN